MADVVAGISLLKSSDGEWSNKGEKMPWLFFARDEDGCVWIGCGGYALLVFWRRSTETD